MRGGTPARSRRGGSAIRLFLNALDAASAQAPPTLEDQVGRYHSLLAGKRVLIVLDNAADVDQVRPLLPGSSSTCLVVVTSRNHLTGLVADGAHPVQLDLFSRDEARELLGRRVGTDRVAAEPDAAEAIIDRCARLPLDTGAHVDSPGDHDGAMAWFGREHSVLLATMTHDDAGTRRDTYVWQMAWALADFLDRRGHRHDEALTWRAAVGATERLADVPEQARAHRLLARVLAQQERYDDAEIHFTRALDLYGSTVDDPVGAAHTHLNITRMCETRGDHESALAHAREAFRLYGEANYRAGHARALNTVGWFEAKLGHYRQAIDACSEALGLLQDLGDAGGQAQTWDSLGYAYHHLGDGRAVACFRQALALYRDIGDRINEADTLDHLGDAYEAIGDPLAAADAWREAVAILDDIDHPDADRVRDKL